MIRKIISSKVFRWGMVSLYAGLIFLGSSMNIQIEEPTFFFYLPYMDKFVHFIEYGIFCTLLCWAISAHLKGNQLRKFILMAIILTSLYGITDEIHQLFVQTRIATVFDWLADTLGAAVAGTCWLKIFPRWKARH